MHFAGRVGEALSEVVGNLLELCGIASCEVDFTVPLVEDCSEEAAVAR